MAELIHYQRSVIVACDVASLSKLGGLVHATRSVYGIGGYKIGLELVIRCGLDAAVDVVRKCGSTLPIIYDHQKGGTDIPELGPKFAKAVKAAKADAVILFPLSGPSTERTWIKACQDEGLTVLVGGHMTHRAFMGSEGGYIVLDAPEEIYGIAARNGVRDFVVPGNKAEYVSLYRHLLESILGEGNFTLYAPGFIAQGGDITETGKEAGERWHAIVGSALYNQQGVENIRRVAEQLVSQLKGGAQ